MSGSKQSELIKSSLENVKSMFDANTITGTPIELKSGVLIIPVSKIYIGVASGGVDYFGKYNISNTNFGGGGGTGLTVSPIGFLVAKPDGRVELLDFNQAPKDIFSQFFEFVEHSPELFEKIKNAFGSNNEQNNSQSN